jgi:hypothetical protein
MLQMLLMNFVRSDLYLRIGTICSQEINCEHFKSIGYKWK